MSKIGVFDSGFGGLTVLKEIRRLLPQYDYVYLGDTARAPYGIKSQDEIYQFTEEAVDYLFRQDCELIILACNTASSEALRKIQQEYLPKKNLDKRVLGVIIPACEKVVEDGYSNIGIMATPSTVSAGAYIREIKKLNEKAKITQKACPLLVPLIEAGEIDKEILDKILVSYLNDLKDVEVIILGCTHYEIIKKEIEEKAGKIKIVSQSKIVAEKLSDYLKRHPEIESKLSKGGSIFYFSTGLKEKFDKFGSEIVGENIESKKVDII